MVYAPRQFREDRAEVLHAAMRTIQFATLVLSGADGPEAVHLPLIVKDSPGGLRLEGHVAVGNPFWKLAGRGGAALAVFQGPQAYVHPGWYETKRQTGKVVPTWNYVVVHARGSLTVERDPDWLLRHVTELTALNETGRAEPWAVTDAPSDYVAALTRAIVGVSLAVSNLEGVWKLIQHHPDANRQGVIAGLSASARSGDRDVATLMQAREDDRGAEQRS